jgi:uncharacterized membrane protein
MSVPASGYFLRPSWATPSSYQSSSPSGLSCGVFEHEGFGFVEFLVVVRGAGGGEVGVEILDDRVGLHDLGVLFLELFDLLLLFRRHLVDVGLRGTCRRPA